MKGFLINLFSNILLPIAYYLPIAAIVVIGNYAHFTGFYSNVFESWPCLFLFVALIIVYIASLFLGGVSFGLKVISSFSFRGKDYQLLDNGDVVKKGSMGNALIIINFLKCLIIMPIKLIIGIILIPISFFSNGDNMEDELPSIFGALLLLFISIILCVLPVIIHFNRCTKYDASKTEFTYKDIYLDKSTSNYDVYVISGHVSHPKGDITIIKGEINLFYKNECLYIFSIEFYKDELLRKYDFTEQDFIRYLYVDKNDGYINLEDYINDEDFSISITIREMKFRDGKIRYVALKESDEIEVKMVPISPPDTSSIEITHTSYQRRSSKFGEVQKFHLTKLGIF